VGLERQVPVTASNTYCDFCDEAPCRIGDEHRAVSDLRTALHASQDDANRNQQKWVETADGLARERDALVAENTRLRDLLARVWKTEFEFGSKFVLCLRCNAMSGHTSNCIVGNVSAELVPPPTRQVPMTEVKRHGPPQWVLDTVQEFFDGLPGVEGGDSLAEDLVSTLLVRGSQPLPKPDTVALSRKTLEDWQDWLARGHDHKVSDAVADLLTKPS
jgi:hypothetical protein